MEAVILSSPSLNGQEVFIRFTPSGQTGYIDLGLQLLPYTFYFESLVPPLANKAGVFFIYCTGLQCTYEVVVNDIPPTPTPSSPPIPTPTPTVTSTVTITPTNTVTPTITPSITNTQTTTPTITPSITPSCSSPELETVLVSGGFVISSTTYAGFSSSTISISGSNISVGQSIGNTYYWFSGATDITQTGNTQVLSLDLSLYNFPIQVEFKVINNLGCGGTLPIEIVNILDPSIEIISITDDNGCGNGTITFQVTGGYPVPPYGTNELYFVYDQDYTNSIMINSNTPYTFSGYSSGNTYSLNASGYDFGGYASVPFTINYVPCDPLPTLSVFNGGPYCVGVGALFFIFADPDVSWSFINTSGVTIETGTGNGGHLISPTTFNDTGIYTLTGCSSGGCYVQTFDYLAINSIPYVQYLYLRSTSVSSYPDGYIEIGIGGGDGSYSISDGALYSTFGSPAIFSNVVSGYSGAFSISDGNLCGTFLPVTLDLCTSYYSINFTANTTTPSIGGDLILSAYGGTTYRYYRIEASSSPIYDVTVSGDPITGSTVTVTNDYQLSDSGTYVVIVTDATGCTDYSTIVIT